MRSPADDELGAAGERIRDVALDLGDRRLVDERANLHALREAVCDLERGDRLGESGDESVVDAVLDEHAVRRDAGLARVAELADERRGDRE